VTLVEVPAAQAPDADLALGHDAVRARTLRVGGFFGVLIILHPCAN